MHGMAEPCSIRTSAMSDNVGDVGDVDLISPNIDPISPSVVECGAMDVNRRVHR